LVRLREQVEKLQEMADDIEKRLTALTAKVDLACSELEDRHETARETLAGLRTETDEIRHLQTSLRSTALAVLDEMDRLDPPPKKR
jgi:predicted  nucleic acid-binding Zn-ribbon protein